MLAEEIAEDLRAALEQIEEILEDVGGVETSEPAASHRRVEEKAT